MVSALRFSPSEQPATPASPASPLADDQLARRIVADLQRHVDLMLDVRLREALAPVLARAADAIVRDARQQLAQTLRDVVDQAIASERARP